MKIATLGHEVFFSPHGIEKSPYDECQNFYYDHNSRRFLINLLDFYPDITLIYRPEMYTKSMLKAIPGLKIGFSSEPLPKFVNNRLIRTEQTDLREPHYQRLRLEEFDAFFHYDKLSEEYFHRNRVFINGYRQLPINTDLYNPFSEEKKEWDVVFIGKPTERRIRMLEWLKLSQYSFLWIAHGISGENLARVLKKSRVVLNIHADDAESFEPRTVIAAACGCAVVSEPMGDFSESTVLKKVVYTKFGEICDACIKEGIKISEYSNTFIRNNWLAIRKENSTLAFIKSVYTMINCGIYKKPSGSLFNNMFK